MQFLLLVLVVFFASIATAIMSYTTMAMPIGPWIAPIIVLGSLLILKWVNIKKPSFFLALVTAGGSIGGIIATACSFSYPTLYFLDPMLFKQWLADPVYFVSVLSGLVFVAGMFGIVGANFFEYSLIVDQKLSFPIGQLVYKMIMAGDQIKKATELAIGFIGTFVFCFFQDGMRIIPSLFPRSVVLLSQIQIGTLTLPTINFDLWPMLWAIGFVTGHLIALPLGVGALLKIGFVEPAHIRWFSYLSSIEFILAFCSGMVLYGAVVSFVALPSMLTGAIQWFSEKKTFLSQNNINIKNNNMQIMLTCGVIGSGIFYLRYFQFSFLSIIFLYSTTFACMYQIAIIAGKFGIAPLGRFATFVMIPAMLLFQLNITQIVMVATFVEICCGVVADVLFGRKIAYLMNIDRRSIFFYQVVGLIVSSVVVGIVFWVLLSHFQLGSSELFAAKARSRHLLISAQKFDVYVLLLGALCSLFLSYTKINPMLVLGGILMPLNFSIGLIFGGWLTTLVTKREEWEPFWSGVFTSNSLWMLVRALC